MRRSASEKLEIIHLVEQSELPVRTTLRQLGIASSTFYGWYSRFLEGGFDALQDRRPAARARWNKIPEKIRSEILELALEKTELSARELACRFTDERRYFLSESSVYRILKAHDLITSPAYVLMSAGNAFKQPTRYLPRSCYEASIQIGDDQTRSRRVAGTRGSGSRERRSAS